MKQCSVCNLKYPSESTTCFVDGALLVEIQDPLIGTTIAGRYLIEDVVGEGGMATVYRARHRLVDRPCAVKIMSPALAGNKVVRERFRREAKSAQKLAHPNIIEIFDQGELEDGTIYLVMELLVGESLAALVERGRVPLDQALPQWIQIARALARAHDFEVIHRDLKPENIFLARAADGSEIVKLLDFGIARSLQDPRLTGAGEVFGTPQYMAPERITSTEAGPAADLYAVGVIMFEMLTGQLPFDAPDIASFFLKHMKEAPPSPRSFDDSIPEAIDRLVLQLMAKEPKDRPVDAHRLLNDLVAIAGTIGIRVPEEAFERFSDAGPAPTLPPVALDRWVRRTVVFEQMLSKSYPSDPPRELMDKLSGVKHFVREVSELRNRGMSDQRKLETIERRGREGRQRFGHAMDALGIDASRARDAAKEAEAAVAELLTEFESQRVEVVTAHRAIILWEGRSGFQEPYAELSQAYRDVAQLMDDWVAIKARVTRAQELAATKRTEVDDLEFQIKSLRDSMARHEEITEQERAECERAISDAGKTADRLESELLELASAFCAPLRSNPELRPLFQELEADAA